MVKGLQLWSGIIFYFDNMDLKSDSSFRFRFFAILDSDPRLMWVEFHTESPVCVHLSTSKKIHYSNAVVHNFKNFVKELVSLQFHLPDYTILCSGLSEEGEAERRDRRSASNTVLLIFTP